MAEKKMFAAHSTPLGVDLAIVAVARETEKSYLIDRPLVAEQLVGFISYIPTRIDKTSGTCDILLFERGSEAARHLVEKVDKEIARLRDRIDRLESNAGPLRKILEQESKGRV